MIEDRIDAESAVEEMYTTLEPSLLGGRQQAVEHRLDRGHQFG